MRSFPFLPSPTNKKIPMGGAESGSDDRAAPAGSLTIITSSKLNASSKGNLGSKADTSPAGNALQYLAQESDPTRMFEMPSKLNVLGLGSLQRRNGKDSLVETVAAVEAAVAEAVANKSIENLTETSSSDMSSKSVRSSSRSLSGNLGARPSFIGIIYPHSINTSSSSPPCNSSNSSSSSNNDNYNNSSNENNGPYQNLNKHAGPSTMMSPLLAPASTSAEPAIARGIDPGSRGSESAGSAVSHIHSSPIPPNEPALERPRHRIFRNAFWKILTTGKSHQMGDAKSQPHGGSLSVRIDRETHRAGTDAVPPTPTHLFSPHAVLFSTPHNSNSTADHPTQSSASGGAAGVHEISPSSLASHQSAAAHPDMGTSPPFSMRSHIASFFSNHASHSAANFSEPHANQSFFNNFSTTSNSAAAGGATSNPTHAGRPGLLASVLNGQSSGSYTSSSNVTSGNAFGPVVSSPTSGVGSSQSWMPGVNHLAATSPSIPDPLSSSSTTAFSSSTDVDEVLGIKSFLASKSAPQSVGREAGLVGASLGSSPSYPSAASVAVANERPSFKSRSKNLQQKIRNSLRINISKLRIASRSNSRTNSPMQSPDASSEGGSFNLPLAASATSPSLLSSAPGGAMQSGVKLQGASALNSPVEISSALESPWEVVPPSTILGSKAAEVISEKQFYNAVNSSNLSLGIVDRSGNESPNLLNQRGCDKNDEIDLRKALEAIFGDGPTDHEKIVRRIEIVRVLQGVYQLPSALEAKYTIGEVLGDGAFGFVLVANRNSDECEVAIKFIIKEKIPRNEWAMDPKTKRPCPLEILILSSLRHPSIISFLDSYEDARYFYLVTELHGTQWDACNPLLNPTSNPGIRKEEPAPSSDFREAFERKEPEVDKTSSSAAQAASAPGFQERSYNSEPTLASSEKTEDTAPNSSGGRSGKKKSLLFRRRTSCDLFECIDAHFSLSEEIGRKIFRQIVSAIQYLHNRGIVHRDIKDENIVIDNKYCVKLIDFGSAAFFVRSMRGNGSSSSASVNLLEDSEDGSLLTPESVAIEPKLFDRFNGTIQFAPPEVLHGRNYRGPEAEIWSLGVLLYTILYGQNPFNDPEQIITGECSPPPDHIQVSQDAQDLLHRMLTVEIDRRININEISRHPWLRQHRSSI